MKITQEFARGFADEWIAAWNGRRIEAIMGHYAEDVVFSSPFILKAGINGMGTLHGKANLQLYFERALEKNPDLRFDLQQVMVGIKSITLIYTRKQVLLATEVMVLNAEGKVVEGMSHYPIEAIYALL